MTFSFFVLPGHKKSPRTVVLRLGYFRFILWLGKAQNAQAILPAIKAAKPIAKMGILNHRERQ